MAGTRMRVCESATMAWLALLLISSCECRMQEAEAQEAGESGPAGSWVTDDWLQEIAISPDGRYLVAAREDGLVDVWDTQRSGLLCTYRGHAESAARAIDISRDGRLVASGGLDGSLHIWSLADGTLRRTWSLEPPNPKAGITSLAFSDGSDRLFFAGCGGVGVIDVSDRSHAEPRFLGRGHLVTAVRVSPSGRDVVAACHDTRWGPPLLPEGSASLPEEWSGSRGRLILWRDFQGPGEIISGSSQGTLDVRYSSDGKYMAALDNESLHLWRGETYQFIGAQVVGSIAYPFSLAWAPKGPILATIRYGAMRGGGDPACEAVVWDVEAGALIRSMDCGDLTRAIPLFSPDGHRLYIGTTRGRIQVWEVETGEKLTEFTPE